MPRRPSSRRAWSRRVGRSWPGTSMSVITSSISWRSTRVRRRRSWSSRFAGGGFATSGCRRRPSITANACGCGLPPTACWIGALPDGGRVPRLPLRSTSSSSSPAGEGGPRVRHHRAAFWPSVAGSCPGCAEAGRAGRTLCYTPRRSGSPVPGEPHPTARPRHRARRSSHADRPDRGGAGATNGIPRPRPSPATRSAEERTEQEVAHRAVRFDAAAARGRSPLRPPDPPLESQDAPVHLRGAQRDPHHRPRPDRPASGRGARGRARHRGARRPGAVRRDEEAGAGADRGRRRREPTCRTSTSAGSAGC